MNKISDLKIGNKVVTIIFGVGIVKSKPRTGEYGKDFVVKLTNFEIKNNGCPYFCEHEIDWQKTTELNNKQMKVKEQTIILPYGYEVDKEKSTFEKIVFKEIENKLPMSVEEIPNRNYFLTHKLQDYRLSTKERAEAFLALMQLVELRDAYNGDWKADWTDISQMKFIIYYSNKICKSKSHNVRSILTFKSEQLQDQFAEQFSELIETAEELL